MYFRTGVLGEWPRATNFRREISFSVMMNLFTYKLMNRTKTRKAGIEITPLKLLKNIRDEYNFCRRSQSKSLQLGAFASEIWNGGLAIDINGNRKSASQISYNNYRRLLLASVLSVRVV